MAYSMLGPTKPCFDPVKQRQWQERMRAHGYNPADFVYDNFCRDKAYQKPRWQWTAEEAVQWDAEAVLEPDEGPESGVEWHWEKTSELCRIGARLPIELAFPAGVANCVDAAGEILTALPNTGSLSKPFSLRCGFCTYIHSSVPCSGCAGGSGQKPPEDVAARVARALVVLASLWHGRQYCLVAALVWRCASKWRELEDFLESLPAWRLGPCSPGSQNIGEEVQVPGSASTRCVNMASQLHASDVRFPFDEDLYQHGCVLPAWMQELANLVFISYVAGVRQDLLARVQRALEPQQRQQAIDSASRIERTSSARLRTHAERQEVLRKYDFASPIFALVSDMQPPRLTIGATSDCTYLVPWSQRSLWERSCAGQACYELPPRSSLWQSDWTGGFGKHFCTLPRT